MNTQTSGHIFLIGFMGAGKSTVAAGLEHLLGRKRAEMDAMIVEEQGMAIADIFAQYGEAYFRDLETNTLIELGKQPGMIISCGGGIVLREENKDHMRKSGRVVLLAATPETIYDRVKDSKDRPVLNGNMNVEFIRGLMEARRPFYEAAADITIWTDGKCIDEICQEIDTRLKEMDQQETV